MHNIKDIKTLLDKHNSFLIRQNFLNTKYKIFKCKFLQIWKLLKSRLHNTTIQLINKLFLINIF